jgi:hypothetical protein
VLAGVALALGELPAVLVEAGGLGRRVHYRGGEPEVWFLLGDAERALPVWRDGRLEVLRWGTRRADGPGLPCTAWARLATLQEGGWGGREPEPAVVPASLGLDGGIWFRTRQGIRAVVVRDGRGVPVVYPLVEPASHYYEVMTRSEWMPVLVGERI